MAMRFLALLGAVVLLSQVLPSASALSVGGSDILVFPVGSTTESAFLGETATFQWLFYNNGTTQYLISIDVSSFDSFVVGVSDATFLLRPEESRQVTITVNVPLSGPDRTYEIAPFVEALNLATGAVSMSVLSDRLVVEGATVAENPRGKVLGRYPNFLPAPFDNEWGAFGLTVFVWIVISVILVFVVDPIVRGTAKRTKTRIDDLVLRILRGPLFVLILVYGATESLGILGIPLDWLARINAVRDFLVILLITWIAYRLFRDVLISYGKEPAAKTRSAIQERLIPAFDKVGSVAIAVVGLILAVQSLGFDITLFLAGLGVMGLILAFAAQETLSNFFAGVHLMLDRPFERGDLIRLESGEICEVRDVGLRSTKLYWGRGNTILIMPNSKLAGTKIINYMRPDQSFKVHIPVGVAYGSDIRKVRRILLEIAAVHRDVVNDEAHGPIFQVDDFGESAVVVRLIFWVGDPRLQWRVASEIRERILERFAQEGIEIPFPQRVLWTPRAARSDRAESAAND